MLKMQGKDPTLKEFIFNEYYGDLNESEIKQSLHEAF